MNIDVDGIHEGMKTDISGTMRGTVDRRQQGGPGNHVTSVVITV